MNGQIIKPYKKEYDYSYAAGAYATIELIEGKPQRIRAVYIHSRYRDRDGLEALCQSRGIPVIREDNCLRRVNDKENTYVLGLFDKYEMELAENRPHVVLVNPSDMGNLGTILRTVAGFGIRDLAIITPAADVWNPKTVRASMGAVFRLRFRQFACFEEYRQAFPAHQVFPFMLDGRLPLRRESCPHTPLYSLVFGNEATGLDPCFHGYGPSIRIDHSHAIDSLNLSIAVGIGVYLFTDVNGTEPVGASP